MSLFFTSYILLSFPSLLWVCPSWLFIFLLSTIPMILSLFMTSAPSLPQVSTWFANARRRLKKENKVTWSPRACKGSDDRGCDDDSDEAEKPVKDEKDHPGKQKARINQSLHFSCFKVTCTNLGFFVWLIFCRSTVCRAAEWSGGLRPAGVWRFRLWTEATIPTWGQWRKPKHRSPTWAPHTQPWSTSQKRQIVPGLPQTHTSPTPKHLLLSKPRPSRHRCQAENMVHRSHGCVSGWQLAARVPSLYAVVQRLLLSCVSVKYGAH